MHDEKEFEVITERDLEYACHDGVSLRGTLWRPAKAGIYPAVVAIPGGAWQQGGPEKFAAWGPWLAARGWAVFGISYRYCTPSTKSWPECFLDVRAAVQFIKGSATDFGIDPERISAIGDSAGGHLAALVGLAGNHPQFSSFYPQDRFAQVSTSVRAIVGAYGVYDLAAQWRHDLTGRPANNNIVERLMGFSLASKRRPYFEGSPLSYAETGNAGPSFLLVHGTEDDVVDRTQTDEFHLALRVAGLYSRRLMVQGAGHYFMSEPIDEPNSVSAWLAPRIFRFLQERA